jgi:hypothetical protein
VLVQESWSKGRISQKYWLMVFASEKISLSMHPVWTREPLSAIMYALMDMTELYKYGLQMVT